MPGYDIILLTASFFLKAEPGDWYVENILEDDRLLTEAFSKRGLNAARLNWDDRDFDWSNTKCVIVRTPWDYFSRYEEFSKWFEETAKVTKFINSYDIIKWNIDKHYMLDLKAAGINIPETIFIEPGDTRTLKEISKDLSWDEFILKPAISGGAWNTFRFTKEQMSEHEEKFRELIQDKCMLLQEFQNKINSYGEVSYMVFGGSYTHSVLKKAKGDDYRVQDDFGGSVHEHNATDEEIKFAEEVVKLTKPGVPYARVDVMTDNKGKLTVGELELFEPELWFRKNPHAAEIFAGKIAGILKPLP